MKKIKIIMLLLFATAIGWTQQEVEDFRGLAWNTPLEAVEFDNEADIDLIHRGRSATSNYYERRYENLTIGTAMLKNITYVFDENDLFYKVILSGDASVNEDMEYILLQRFGKPDKRLRKKTKSIRVWNIGEVDIILSEQKSKDFVVHFQSNEAEEKFEKDNTTIDDF